MTRPDEGIDLIAAYFTLAGDIYPLGPTEVSPWPFEDRVAAASKAGFRGVGLYYADLVATSERLGLPAMRSLLDEHGIEYVELEFIGDWFAEGERRAVSDRWRSDLLHAAEVLRAHHIKAGGDLTGQVWPMDRMAREFRSLGRDANQAGTQIALELMPFSNIHTLDIALELMAAADAVFERPGADLGRA
jgi:sugar phosphate isomerase/epimerase